MSVKFNNKDIKRFINEARKLTDDKTVKAVMKDAGRDVLAVAKSNVRDHDKPVSRYLNGVKVATYYPGNLRRSLKILTNLGRKSKYHIFIGAKLANKNPHGIFKGNRVDGHYAHMVEFGTENSAKKPYWRPAVDSMKNATKRKIAQGMLNIIRKNAKAKGIG